MSLHHPVQKLGRSIGFLLKSMLLGRMPDIESCHAQPSLIPIASYVSSCRMGTIASITERFSRSTGKKATRDLNAGSGRATRARSLVFFPKCF